MPYYKKIIGALALAAMSAISSNALATPSSLQGASCPVANNIIGPDGTGNNLICDSGTSHWRYTPYIFGDDPNYSDSATSCTVPGEVRWNVTNSYLQYCNGSAWLQFNGSGGTFPT